MNKKELTLRIGATVLGNLLIALGVAFAKAADLGLDPFNGQCMSVAAFIGISYPVYTWIFNLVCFSIIIIFGRRYINIGTFVNWFLVSWAANLFLKFKENLNIPSPDSLIGKIPVLVCGLVISSLGVAVYQEADLGVAPYDALPLVFCDRHSKFPFFWARMIVDSVCALGMVLTHSDLIGIGTLIYAFGLGPIINTFTVMIRKWFPNAQRKAKE